MSKLTSLIRRAPKRFAGAVAVLAAAVIIPAAALAWGPDRPTYTVAHPADHITFNSITDNPNVGDERNFVVVKDAANTADGGWQDNITVQPGKEYLVRIYAHNNAASSLNLVATNTRVMASVPNTTGTNVSISGFVTADNAQPKQVWDDIHFNSTENFNLTYEPGSARIYNNGYAAGGSGQPLSDSIVTSNGALIGYNGPDGNVPGCFQYANYIYFKVKVQFPKPDFTVKKEVRNNGQGSFAKSVAANPGDTLNYRITYDNTGNVQANNVILKDKLPAGITFVPGTVKIMNANNLGGAYVQDGDNLFSSGINIGAYTAGSNALVIFNAKVASNDQLPTCGPNTLTNNVSAQPEGLTAKSDTADTTVNKDCQPPQVAYACKALGVTTVDRTHFKFTTSYTAQNATFKSVTYVIKNAAGQVVDTKTSNATTLDYTQETVGKYTVQATVTFSVNGQDKTATSEACTQPFEVVEQGKIQVCDLNSKQIVTINESDFNASTQTKDLSQCQSTPVTPPELPHTGMTENIVAVVGLGALIASAAYYIASRRALNQ